MTPPDALQQAISAHQSGNLGVAERLYQEILRSHPREAAARHLLGVIRAQQGRNDEALHLIGAALEVRPDAPEILSNYANVLMAQNRPAEALANYDKALATKPDHPGVLNKRGMALRELGRLDEALSSYDRALALAADFPDALSNRAVALSGLGRHDDALRDFDRALALAPDFPDAHNNRALTLKALKRLDEALASCDRALALVPGFVEALNNRGIILFDRKRQMEAIACYDRALAIAPFYAEALNNRAVALWDLRRFAEALESCDRALALRPDFADAHYNRGNALSDLNRQEEALAAYEQALAADPAHRHALSGLANAALMIGDWSRTAALTPRLVDTVSSGSAVIQPFVLMGYVDDNALQLRASENYVRASGPGPQVPLWRGEKYDHDRIRVAYLSADFHQHVTAALTVEMFERHDRARFETIAVSLGPDDGSTMRERLKQGFDRFFDASALDDRAVAGLLREWEVDIAIDMGGHTSGARPWILAHRPAPVQAKYMGYPGTSGSDFVDYLIADRMVVPAHQDGFFSEKIASLPDTLWVTDTRREIPPPPSRAEAGLPETGFVFCCFNHNWKITAPVFDVWMRLLTAIPGSVMWLLQGNASISENLRRAATARGVEPARLIFAGRTTPEAHLARQQLSDLFLDTLPYNAHTTASDALWVGLPLLTTPGASFPSRVAASVLQAANLPEMIAPDLSAYETLALELARNPARLVAMRDRLIANRHSLPLFDTARFTRNLEAAYVTMLERQQSGDAPRSFVAATP